MEDIAGKIKDNCDIVDVIGRYVTLKRAGSYYKGCCPFHKEKTPSFMVSPEKQNYVCYGCGKWGDLITFVQEIENLDFMDACRKLADEAGIEIKSYDRSEKKNELYDISREAAVHFYKNLRKGDNPGVRYVVSRGISPETAQKFGIGYAVDQWENLTSHLKSKGFRTELAVEAGLTAQKSGGKTYDMFKNRVIFPIMNTRGKVIGFGGRTITGDYGPKYLNSPESDIFKKKENLYGLNLARNAIRREQTAILVEGYMDVVSLADAGVENAVATLGTALTPEQAKLLSRYTDTVVLSYDSDNAGQNATERGIEILQTAGLKIKILQLDEGKDPDEYIKKNGRAAFEERVKNAVPHMKWKIDRIKDKYDLKNTDESIRFLEEVSMELSKIKVPVEQAHYVKIVSEMTGLPESSISRQIQVSMGKAPAQPAPRTQQKEENKREVPLQRIDKSKAAVVRPLINLMLHNADFILRISADAEVSDYFYGSGYEGLMEKLVSCYSDDGEVDEGELRNLLEENEESFLDSIIRSEIDASDSEMLYESCRRTIRVQKLENESRKLRRQLDVAQDENEIVKMMNRVNEIAVELKEIKEGSIEDGR